MKNKGLKQITNNKKTLKNLLNPNEVKKGGSSTDFGKLCRLTEKNMCLWALVHNTMGK